MERKKYGSKTSLAVVKKNRTQENTIKQSDVQSEEKEDIGLCDIRVELPKRVPHKTTETQSRNVHQKKILMKSYPKEEGPKKKLSTKLALVTDTSKVLSQHSVKRLDQNAKKMNIRSQRKISPSHMAQTKEEKCQRRLRSGSIPVFLAKKKQKYKTQDYSRVSRTKKLSMNLHENIKDGKEPSGKQREGLKRKQSIEGADVSSKQNVITRNKADSNNQSSKKCNLPKNPVKRKHTECTNSALQIESTTNSDTIHRKSHEIIECSNDSNDKKLTHNLSHRKSISNDISSNISKKSSNTLRKTNKGKHIQMCSTQGSDVERAGNHDDDKNMERHIKGKNTANSSKTTHTTAIKRSSLRSTYSMDNNDLSLRSHGRHKETQFVDKELQQSSKSYIKPKKVLKQKSDDHYLDRTKKEVKTNGQNRRKKSLRVRKTYADKINKLPILRSKTRNIAKLKSLNKTSKCTGKVNQKSKGNKFKSKKKFTPSKSSESQSVFQKGATDITENRTLKNENFTILTTKCNSVEKEMITSETESSSSGKLIMDNIEPLEGLSIPGNSIKENLKSTTTKNKRWKHARAGSTRLSSASQKKPIKDETKDVFNLETPCQATMYEKLLHIEEKASSIARKKPGRPAGVKNKKKQFTLRKQSKLGTAKMRTSPYDKNVLIYDLETTLLPAVEQEPEKNSETELGINNSEELFSHNVEDNSKAPIVLLQSISGGVKTRTSFGVNGSSPESENVQLSPCDKQIEKSQKTKPSMRGTEVVKGKNTGLDVDQTDLQGEPDISQSTEVKNVFTGFERDTNTSSVFSQSNLKMELVSLSEDIRSDYGDKCFTGDASLERESGMNQLYVGSIQKNGDEKSLNQKKKLKRKSKSVLKKPESCNQMRRTKRNKFYKDRKQRLKQLYILKKLLLPKKIKDAVKVVAVRPIHDKQHGKNNIDINQIENKCRLSQMEVKGIEVNLEQKSNPFSEVYDKTIVGVCDRNEVGGIKNDPQIFESHADRSAIHQIDEQKNVASSSSQSGQSKHTEMTDLIETSENSGNNDYKTDSTTKTEVKINVIPEKKQEEKKHDIEVKLLHNICDDEHDFNTCAKDQVNLESPGYSNSAIGEDDKSTPTISISKIEDLIAEKKSTNENKAIDCSSSSFCITENNKSPQQMYQSSSESVTHDKGMHNNYDVRFSCSDSQDTVNVDNNITKDHSNQCGSDQMPHKCDVLSNDLMENSDSVTNDSQNISLISNVSHFEDKSFISSTTVEESTKETTHEKEYVEKNDISNSLQENEISSSVDVCQIDCSSHHPIIEPMLLIKEPKVEEKLLESKDKEVDGDRCAALTNVSRSNDLLSELETHINNSPINDEILKVNKESIVCSDLISGKEICENEVNNIDSIELNVTQDKQEHDHCNETSESKIVSREESIDRIQRDKQDDECHHKFQLGQSETSVKSDDLDLEGIAKSDICFKSDSVQMNLNTAGEDKESFAISYKPGKSQRKKNKKQMKKLVSNKDVHKTRRSFTKRGELDLLFDVDGPPSKIKRNEREKRLTLGEKKTILGKKITIKSKREKKGIVKFGQDISDGYNDSLKEKICSNSPELLNPCVTFGNGDSGLKRKMITRGKKNRYWYLFAKQDRKGNLPALLCKPDDADVSEYQHYRKKMYSKHKTSKCSKSLKLKRKLKFVGETSLHLTNTETECHTNIVPYSCETSKLKEPKVPKLVIKLPPGTLPAVQKDVTEDKIQEILNVKRQINVPPTPHIKQPVTETVISKTKVLLEQCQPCSIVLVDFANCLNLQEERKVNLKKSSPSVIRQTGHEFFIDCNREPKKIERENNDFNTKNLKADNMATKMLLNRERCEKSEQVSLYAPFSTTSLSTCIGTPYGISQNIGNTAKGLSPFYQINPAVPVIVSSFPTVSNSKYKPILPKGFKIPTGDSIFVQAKVKVNTSNKSLSKSPENDSLIYSTNISSISQVEDPSSCLNSESLHSMPEESQCTKYLDENSDLDSDSSEEAQKIAKSFTLTSPKYVGQLKKTARKQIKKTCSENTAPQRYRCLHCTYTCSSKTVMCEHIYNHTNIVPYSCGHCGSIFGTRSGVMVHTKRDHSGMTHSIIKNSTLNEEEYFTTNVNYHQIKEAVKAARKENIDNIKELNLDKQAKFEHLDRCNIEPSYTNNTLTTLLTESVRSSKQKIIYRCPYCNTIEEDPNGIKKHATTGHKDDTHYTCPLCEVSFFNHIDSVRKHIQKWHKCPQIEIQLENGYYKISIGSGYIDKEINLTGKTREAIYTGNEIACFSKKMQTARKSMPKQNASLVIEALNVRKKAKVSDVVNQTSIEKKPHNDASNSLLTTNKDNVISMSLPSQQVILNVPVVNVESELNRTLGVKQAVPTNVMKPIKEVFEDHSIKDHEIPNTDESELSLLITDVKSLRDANLTNMEETNVDYNNEPNVIALEDDPVKQQNIGESSEELPERKNTLSPEYMCREVSSTSELETNGLASVSTGVTKSEMKNVENIYGENHQRKSLKVFECKLCKSQMKEISIWEKHMYNIHEIRVSYSCPYCSYTSTRLDKVQVYSHIENIHKDKPREVDIPITNEKQYLNLIIKEEKNENITSGNKNKEISEQMMCSWPSSRSNEDTVENKRIDFVEIENDEGVILVPQTNKPSSSNSINHIFRLNKNHADSKGSNSDSLSSAETSSESHKPPTYTEALLAKKKSNKTSLVEVHERSKKVIVQHNDPAVINVKGRRLDQPLDFSVRYKAEDTTGFSNNLPRRPPPLIPMGIVNSSQVVPKSGTEVPVLTRAPISLHDDNVTPLCLETMSEESSSDEDETAIEAFNVFNLEPPLVNNKPTHSTMMDIANSDKIDLKDGSQNRMDQYIQFQARKPIIDPTYASKVKSMHCVPSPQNPIGTSLLTDNRFAMKYKDSRTILPEYKFTKGPPNVVIIPNTHKVPQRFMRTLNCPYCVYKCDKMEVLHNHILTHEPNVKWTCPYCPMPNQMTKSVVEKHIKICHPGAVVMYIPFGVQPQNVAK